MRPVVFVLVGLVLSASPVLAQQQQSSAEAFANEWSALDGSLNAVTVQRQHLVEKAKMLVGDWQRRGDELDYWHRWFEGEKAAWSKPKP